MTGEGRFLEVECGAPDLHLAPTTGKGGGVFKGVGGRGTECGGRMCVLFICLSIYLSFFVCVLASVSICLSGWVGGWVGG